MQHLIKKSREFLERNLGIIPRKRYLDQLTSRIDIGLVTVVTGMRRTGKSLLVIDYLQKLDTRKVFYFSKEFDVLAEVNTVSDLQALFDLYTSIHGEPTYIVIDEIQDIAEWEKFIRAVFAEKRYKIVITGSNAHLLSGELATFLSGRYIPVHVAPLTYNEFLLFTKRKHTDDIVREYLFYGGLPEITKISLMRDKESYLGAITDSVLLKDIITRHQVRDSAVLRRILSFFADNVGSLTTLRNISNYFIGQHITFSFPTILNYVSYFKEACIIEELRRYDIRGKKMLEINNKYYFSDTGMRNSILGRYDGIDIAKTLENAVLTHLQVAGYTVSVGKYDATEIDFIAEDSQGNKKYIQVSYLLSEETTWQREITPLLKIQDAYPRYIITLDPYRRGNHEGINIIGFEEMEIYFS